MERDTCSKRFEGRGNVTRKGYWCNESRTRASSLEIKGKKRWLMLPPFCAWILIANNHCHYPCHYFNVIYHLRFTNKLPFHSNHPTVKDSNRCQGHDIVSCARTARKNGSLLLLSHACCAPIDIQFKPSSSALLSAVLLSFASHLSFQVLLLQTFILANESV